MPRQKRMKLTTAEKIEAVKEQIKEAEQHLENLTKELAELENAIQEEKRSEVMAALDASGKSFNEIMEFLKN